MNDNIVICMEHEDIVSELSDGQAGQVLKALLRQEAPPEDVAARIVYKTIKAQVDRYKEKYRKRSEAGKHGLQKRWSDSKPIANDSKSIANDSKALQTIAPVPVPDPIPKPIKEISPEGDTKKSRFAPPTLQAVQEYAAEKGYTIDAEHFIDYYESNGWKVGKNPMKDWKAAVRNWSKNEFRSQRQGVTAKGFNNFPQRQYDYDDLERRLSGF